MTNTSFPERANFPEGISAPYKLPPTITEKSWIVEQLAQDIQDQIMDQVYQWAMDLPEISLPIDLEDEELDEAVSQVTSQLEILVYKNLIAKAGIKI